MEKDRIVFVLETRSEEGLERSARLKEEFSGIGCAVCSDEAMAKFYVADFRGFKVKMIIIAEKPSLIQAMRASSRKNLLSFKKADYFAREFSGVDVLISWVGKDLVPVTNDCNPPEIQPTEPESQEKDMVLGIPGLVKGIHGV